MCCFFRHFVVMDVGGNDFSCDRNPQKVLTFILGNKTRLMFFFWQISAQLILIMFYIMSHLIIKIGKL